MTLDQQTADHLLRMAKRRTTNRKFRYPSSGATLTVPLVAVNGRERFLLDLRRGRIKLSKGTYQNRARKSVVLARLDFGGHPHRNPDGEEVGRCHLHVYREGFGDKYAYNLPYGGIGAGGHDPSMLLRDFVRYCNIVKQPKILGGLHS